jgi:hypothetical protein
MEFKQSASRVLYHYWLQLIGDRIMSLTFEQATHMRNIFEAKMKDAAQALKSIEGVGAGLMGLTPDHVKASREYQEARRRFDWDFDSLRKFNVWYVKTFKRELARERAAKHAA